MLLAVALSLPYAVIDAAPAAAAPAWSTQVSQAPQIPNGTINDISCRSVNFCFAAGSYVSPSGEVVPLAETWNGSAWTLRSPPLISGATSASFADVSCSTSTFCVAVGSYRTSTGDKPLTMIWNGSTWTRKAGPVPTGTTAAYLLGVWCSSAWCMAVGEYVGSGGRLPLTMFYDGATWTRRTGPVPSGASGGLAGVSCRSASWCTAVGSYISDSDFLPLTMFWNGTSWTRKTAPVPSGAEGTFLQSVSCWSTSACMAVGSYDVSTGFLPLAMIWNGTSWARRTAPLPSGAVGSLGDVSCTTASNCIGVGSFSPESVEMPLTMAWNGTSWARKTAPQPAGATRAYLRGVSCPTAWCMGAGAHSNPGGPRALTMSWSGSEWTLRGGVSPPGAADSELYGVSCPSANWCTAVGNYRSSTGRRALAMRWNGSSWAAQTTPAAPVDSTTINLVAVSCFSNSACTAVGSYRTSAGFDRALALRWNGSTWSSQSVPLPEGASDTVLNGVSCATANECTAVGFSEVGSDDLMLGMTWAGNTWTLADTPAIPGEGLSIESLEAVSCSSATVCFAAGYATYSDGVHTVAVSRSGTNWQLLTTSDPSASRRLYDVSCHSSTVCTMVGAAAAKPLSQRWTSGAWAIHTTPNPDASGYNTATGVSCTAASACVAVGNTGLGGVPFSMAYNGSTWTLFSVPKPAETSASTLPAVSCWTGTSCIAVGFVRRSVDVPFVLRSQ